MTPTVHSRPKVLIADDDFATIAGLSRLLSREYQIVGEVAQLAHLLEDVQRLAPDAVVVDIRFRKQGNALEVIRAGRSRGAFHCPFIVHTMFDSRDQIRLAFAAGASGFVGKGESFERLSAVLKAALRKESLVPEWLQLPDSNTRSDGAKGDRGVMVDGVRLTIKELEVLLRINAGDSNAEIGLRLGISERTVEYHVREVRKRTDMNTRIILSNWVAENIALIRAAVDRGL